MDNKPLTRPSEMTSFRRSSIEEGKKERMEDRKEANMSTMFGNLKKTIEDNGPPTRPEQEPVKENRIVEPVNTIENKIETINGPSENNVNSSSEEAKQSNILNTISDKLSKLTIMVQQKLDVIIGKEGPIETTESIVNDKLESSTDKRGVDVVGKVLPSLQEKKESDTAKTAADSERQKLGFASVVGAVKSGFKASVSVADKISSMLFKYTISAVAKSALIVGAIFAIITGIDLLRINFKYWSDMILEKINLWIDNISKWTPWLEGTFTALEGIRTAWEQGDWPGLAEAIILGLGKSLYEFANLISLGFYKALAKALSALGFENAAKGIEGFALQNYVNNTDNALNEKDQQKLAEYQNANLEKGAADVTANGGFSAMLPMWLRKKLHLVTDAEASQNAAERKDRDALMNIPREQRVEVIKQMDNTKSALTRYENHSNNMNLETERDNTRLDKMKKDIEVMINDKSLDAVPTVKKEFKDRLNKIQGNIEKKRNAVKPQPMDKNRDAVTVNNIKKIDATNRAVSANQGAKTDATINNTVVKSNKSINIVTPVTNTASPGIYNGTGVN